MPGVGDDAWKAADGDEFAAAMPNRRPRRMCKRSPWLEQLFRCSAPSGSRPANRRPDRASTRSRTAEQFRRGGFLPRRGARFLAAVTSGFIVCPDALRPFRPPSFAHRIFAPRWGGSDATTDGEGGCHGHAGGEYG